MKKTSLLVMVFALVVFSGCDKSQTGTEQAPDRKPAASTVPLELSDAQVENIVKRSYQYVALYNIIHKFALDPANPTSTGGFNKMNIATQLLDHTMKGIARPNNDTLYITCMMDLRKDPVILDIPVIDSKYVSQMAVGYDHYVNVPLTTRTGDFAKPEKALYYTARTEGYAGEQIEGIDRSFEMTGDFPIVLFRVMPHANDPAQFEKIIEEMKSIKMLTLAEYRGGQAKGIDDIKFPAFGKTDADIFENNLLEVMQFVFNHTTFDPNDEMDQGVLAAYKPLGVEPGKTYDASTSAEIDGKRFRKAAEKVQAQNLALLKDPAGLVQFRPRVMRPKGEMDLDTMVAQSVIGPIGLPLVEATYPNVTTTDGSPLNALNDYAIRMSKEDLPPAQAFWSLTLYDMQNGFFIPNDHKKYSVGENAGMKLNDEGGIEIYVAAEKPEGAPEESWLPINRKDEDMDIILRIYVPDLEKLKTWSAPKAEIWSEGHSPAAEGEAKILQSWQGDYPVGQLDLLPENQRERGIGFIGDAETFAGVWQAFKPGEDVPQIDFEVNLALFARNTQFYNSISIGKVNLKNGVAEALAMETRSAMPIEDNVAMSMVLVAREGITAIQTGNGAIPIAK